MPLVVAVMASSRVSGGEVGQRTAVDVALAGFDGVEFGGVDGEGFDDQPATRAGPEGFHGAAGVTREPFPLPRGPLAATVAAELGENVDECLVVIRAGALPNDEPGGSPIGSVGDRDGDRRSPPVAAVTDDPSLGSGRPGRS